MHVGEEYSIIPAFIINMAGCNLTCPTCPERERWNHLLRPLPAEAYARALISHFDKTSWPKSIEWIGGEPSTQMPYVFDTTWSMRALHPELPTVYLNTNAYFSPFLNPMLAGTGAIDAFPDPKEVVRCMERAPKIYPVSKESYWNDNEG